MCPHILSLCSEWLPKIRIDASRDLNPDQRPPDSSDQRRNLFVVAPWHPVHGPKCQFLLRQISEQWAEYTFRNYGLKVDFKVAWENPGKPLFALVR